mmetsp:Transcript_6400/g.25869  ORF Transcript_6400/g.25869 Transcript_6400/m.25869 type:complete len:228 (-) Transcript_6400:631-1314(-)
MLEHPCGDADLVIGHAARRGRGHGVRTTLRTPGATGTHCPCDARSACAHVNTLLLALLLGEAIEFGHAPHQRFHAHDQCPQQCPTVLDVLRVRGHTLLQVEDLTLFLIGLTCFAGIQTGLASPIGDLRRPLGGCAGLGGLLLLQTLLLLDELFGHRLKRLELRHESLENASEQRPSLGAAEFIAAAGEDGLDQVEHQAHAGRLHAGRQRGVVHVAAEEMHDAPQLMH